jgi:hypothetical protein
MVESMTHIFLVVLVLPLSLIASPIAGGAAPTAQVQQSAQPKKDTTEDEFKAALRKAQLGDAAAQTFVGAAYEYGWGVARDPVQAIDWYRKAAAQGVAEAQFKLGFAYAYGKAINGAVVVPQDSARAVRWYRSAAEQGHAAAQNNLAFLYARGQGVPQDYAQAVAWYRKAAEQEDASAQNTLGDMYREGRGVPQDYATAAGWYRKAAELGYQFSQNALGGLYSSGQGVPQDYVEAYKWFDIGAHAPSETRPSYEAKRDEVAKLMTPAQIAEAQKRVSEWTAAFQKRKK